MKAHMTPYRRVTETEKYFLHSYQSNTLRGAVEKAAREEIDAAMFDEHYGIPIDVERIAKRKCIRIADVGELTCHEARLFPERNGFVVQLKAQSNSLRKRTTLAHEVGHTLFYRDYGDKPRHQVGILDIGEMLAEEKICNWFARALLMPAKRLRDVVLPLAPRRPFSFLELLDQAAKQFEVSLPALILRLSDIGPALPPYLIVSWRFYDNRRTGFDPQLRVDSCTGLGAARNMYVWRNRSAEGVNLRSAVSLFDAWKSLSASSDRGGRYALDPSLGLVQVKNGFDSSVDEDVRVSFFQNGHWKEDSIQMKVSHCLYAKRNADERDATIVSILTPNRFAHP